MNNTTLSKVLERYEALRDHLGGCLDGACVVKRPTGMHTNSRCRCPDDRRKAQAMMRAGQELAGAARSHLDTPSSAGDGQCRTCALMPARPEILFQSIVASVQSFLVREADGDAAAAAEWRRQVELYAQAFAGTALSDRNAELVALLDEVRGCYTRDDDLPENLLPRIDAAIDSGDQPAQVFAGDARAPRNDPAIQPGQLIALETSEQSVRAADGVAEPKIGPDAVYPVPEEAEESRSLEPGPWMPGDMKPAREGGYLRAFDEGDAFSTWRDGKWHTGDFFERESDIQDAPWRGGVLVDGATHADWQREHGGEREGD